MNEKYYDIIALIKIRLDTNKAFFPPPWSIYEIEKTYGWIECQKFILQTVDEYLEDHKDLNNVLK